MVQRPYRYLAPALPALVVLVAITTSATPAAGGTSAPAAVTGRPAPGRGTGTQLLGVTCPTSDDCWAAGVRAGTSPPALILASTDGGEHWRRQAVGAGTLGASASATLSLVGISCADIRHCMAAGSVTAPLPGGAVAVTSDRGRTWSTELGPPGDNALVGVQCSAPGTCVVLAVSGDTYFSAATTDGGSTWQHGGTLPPGFAGASSLVCTSATACRVAGYTATTPGHGNGAIAMTDDGGATWTLATMPSGTGALHAVSCGSGRCVAVGSTSTVTSGVPSGDGVLLASADGGATFTARSPSTVLDDGFGVDCAPDSTTAADACVAVGIRFTHAIPPVPLTSAIATADPGTRVIALRQRYVPAPLVSVTCPSATRCVAVGGSELATVAVPPASSLQPPTRRHGHAHGQTTGHGTTTTG